ncbi:Translation initiation factor 2 subunit beta [uncultured archaeon]|nr:Translation initiation factor 2 subunit beta [uncultured archaeon]
MTADKSKPAEKLGSYDDFLARAYSRLPEKTTKKERLEIPLPETLIQGNKTIIKNFEAITNKLRRDPRHLAKFLAKELATSGNVEGGRLILNSKVMERVLADKMRSYTETFLYCAQCKLPDTKLVEVDRGLNVMVCEACGARTAVPKV